MEFLGKLITFIVLVFIIGMSLLFFMVYTDNEEKEEEEEEEEEEVTIPETETTTNEEEDDAKEDTLQTSARTTYNTEDMDKLTLMTSDDIIYCLKKDNTCEKMSAPDCAENGHIETYLSKNNCINALNNTLNKQDNVWCIKDGYCKKYNKDEIGFGLKEDDVTCPYQYTTETSCKKNSGEYVEDSDDYEEDKHYCYINGQCQELEDDQSCSSVRYSTIELCNKYN